ncbi:hypothetical protein ACF0H5_020302 [Mactra antiquata]
MFGCSKVKDNLSGNKEYQFFTKYFQNLSINDKYKCIWQKDTFLLYLTSKADLGLGDVDMHQYMTHCHNDREHFYPIHFYFQNPPINNKDMTNWQNETDRQTHR